MTYLFLDTEWADTSGRELVSLALVSDDGKHEFYAEVDPLPQAPTEFVRRIVYPLLDRGSATMPKLRLTTALRNFLATVPDPHVLADYPNDLVLLQTALRGFDFNNETLANCGPMPQPVLTHMLKDRVTQQVLEEYFHAYPDQAQRRHHALVDARALRMTWLAVTGRISTPWSSTLTGEQSTFG